MKKSILLFAFAVASIMAYAQTGSWYIGGVAGVTSNASENAAGNTTTSTDWALGPEGGTFLRDDIQLGLFLGLSGGKTKDDNGDISKYSVFSPTVYGRKFFKITDNFSTFAGLYLNIGTGSTTSYFTGGSVTTDLSGFGVRVGVGVAYALSPRFTAVGQYGVLGYQSTKEKVNGSDSGGDSSFGFGVNTVGYGTLAQGNGSGAVFNIGIYYTIAP